MLKSWLKKRKQRLEAKIAKRRKSHPLQWMNRWDKASQRCWKILSNGTPTIERFHRFERNHKRLLKLQPPC